MEKRFTLLLASLFLCVGMALAQIQVKGTIISSDDGEPLPGAQVKVVGTKSGTVTNIDGEFVISVPNAEARLELSHIGMVTRVVRARNGMRIALDTNNSLMDEVIVTAFGQAKRSAFTGSAKVIDAEELAQSQVTSVTNALAGAVPGLQLTSANGGPSSTSTVRIRGFSSLNAGKDPLIILDGAPYGGDIANINPNDVESMTVLKDAASNALYGARGANGVIIITTKKAKRDKDAVVTLDAKYGWNTRALQHYDVISDPAHYYETHFAALRDYYVSQGATDVAAWQRANQNIFSVAGNGGLGYNIWTVPEGQYLIGQDGFINPAATLGRVVNYDGEDYLITPDKWEDVGTRTGIRQEYNVSVSGATEKSNFFLSAGYLKNEGITHNSDMQRFTSRLKADYQAKSWLKVGANISYARFDHNSLGDNGNSTSTGNVWAFANQMAPIYPAYIRNADGSVKIDGNGIGRMDYGEGLNAGQTRPFIYNANPILDNKLNTRNAEGNAVTLNGFADITLYKGLTLTVNGTYNLDETRGTTVLNGYYGQFDSTGGVVEQSHGRTTDFNSQQLLNYTTTIADHHNLNVMLGHEYYDARYAVIGASKSKMFSPSNKQLSGAVVDGKSAYGYRTRYNNEGWFGRALYDYDEKYFLQASYRRDASSRFHPDYRWGSFWSAGVAWRIAKEDWFDVDWVNELKLKASIGSQGNDNISSYLYTDLYDITNSDDQIGTSFGSKGTEDITWETNTNTNIGFEFELFKSRLYGSLEWYYRKTTDMLFSFSVAPSLGYSAYYDNVGDLYNTGFELELGYDVIRQKNVNWNIHLNASSLRNRITKLHEDKKTSSFYTADGKEIKGYTSGSFFISEDQSMYTWRLKDYAGVDETTGESLWWKNTFDTDADGNEVWTGREKTSVYSDADYYVTEQTTVPKFFGGFGTSVKAYGVDFSINLSYQIGGKQYDGTYAQFMASPTNSSAGYNFHKDVLKSWTTENTSSDIPRFQYNDLYTASSSTRFLTNASYLNIENINLGYTLPSQWTRKTQISALRLYVAAENVFYWSKRKGFDPRQSFSASTNATYYSPMRTISGGITLTF